MTAAAMLLVGEAGEGLGVQAPLWCGEGAPALPQGPCRLCCGVWDLNVPFNEKKMIHIVSRYSFKEKVVKK